MRICSRCKEDMAAAEYPEADRRFPAFTVAAGIAGTFAGAATGVLLLVPAAIVLGAAADYGRCDVCGTEMEEGDDGYRLMEEAQEGFGCASYRPAAGPFQGERRQQSSGPGASMRTGASLELPRPSEEGAPVGESDLDVSHRDQAAYVYDEIEGALVPQQAEPEGPAFDQETITPPQAEGDAGGLDGFLDPFGDASVAGLGGYEDVGQGFVEPFDSFDEPPMEEPVI
jgi:hypothetical protein